MDKPRGWRISAPDPVASMSGMALNRAARAVINMGRNRIRAAAWMACCGLSQRRRSASRAESQAVRFVDVVLHEEETTALGSEGEVDHRDTIFLDIADQQEDADDVDPVQAISGQQESQQGPEGDRGKSGKDGDGVKLPFPQ